MFRLGIQRIHSYTHTHERERGEGRGVVIYSRMISEVQVRKVPSTRTVIDTNERAEIQMDPFATEQVVILNITAIERAKRNTRRQSLRGESD